MTAADVRGCDGASNDPAAVILLLDWVSRGLAVVGRTRHAGDPVDCLPVGLALPPRIRLAFNVSARAVVRIDAPLALPDVTSSLPAWMRGTAEYLEQAARERALRLSVYGSVFWQHTSGNAYLHAESDLDLLVQPDSRAQAREWLDVLYSAQPAGVVRIDGEIELPSGEAVAWRELASESDRLLVKSDLGPALWPRERVWSAWGNEVTPDVA